MVTAVTDRYFEGHLRIQVSFTSAGTSHPRQILLRRSLAFVAHLDAGAAFLSRGELTVHVRLRLLLPGPPPLSCTERHTGCQRGRTRRLSPRLSPLPSVPPPPASAPRRQRPVTAAREAAQPAKLSPQPAALTPRPPPAVSHTPAGRGKTRGARTPAAARP